jgi:hypothetical protein
MTALDTGMNEQVRALTADEINNVSGGFWGLIALGLGAMCVGIDIVVIADAVIRTHYGD